MIEYFRFVDGTPNPERIGMHEVAQELANPLSILWIRSASTSETERISIGESLGLLPHVREQLENQEHRIKLINTGPIASVTVRDATLRDDDLELTDVDVAFGPGWLLTHRSGEADGSPFWADLERRIVMEREASGDHDLAVLFWALLDLIVDQYFILTSAFDERIDASEEVVFAGENGTDIPRSLYRLRRSMSQFRRAAAPIREIVSEVIRHEVVAFGPSALPRFHDVYDHILRVNDISETQREVLTGLLEAHLAIVSNNANRVMKATSSWGAILLVSTLIAGIYGMNFEHMPELDWALGYPIALAVMGTITVLLYRAFKRRDWL